jgi:hypothetical protein
VVDPTVSSYRFLRVGLVGAVLTLAVAIVLERLGVDCWQPSVSGYFYTPVRTIFVGALGAAGLGLVVIAGRTIWEDTLLNVAGMLAPVVAIVPTTEVSACWSVPPAAFPVDADSFDAIFAAAIDNNVAALLVTGAIGLAVAAVLALASPRGAAEVVERLDPATRLGLGAVALLVSLTAAGFLWWPAFDRWAHDIAAVGMFACLAAAVWINGRESAEDRQPGYTAVYRTIAIAMVLAGLLLLPVFTGFAHRLFVVEAIEITLFAVFWIVQTRQFWRLPEPVADRGGDRA